MVSITSNNHTASPLNLELRLKEARLNRLFGTSGNCFDVAIDHGMFNEASFLVGIEDMR